MPHLEIRNGERMVLEIRPSWLNFLQHFALSTSVVILLGTNGHMEAGICLAAILLSIPPITRYSHLYSVTTCRVVEKRGLISRHTAEVDLEAIVLLNVHQGIWDRLLGLGKIDMMSAADHGPDVVFRGICDPFAIKETISRLKAQRNQR